MRVPDDNLDVRELEHRYPDEGSEWPHVFAAVITVVVGILLLISLTRAWAGEDDPVRKDIERVLGNAPLLEMEIGTGLPSISGLTAALGPKNARIVISELDRHGYSIVKNPSRAENCVLCVHQAYPERRPVDTKIEDAIRNGLSLSVSTCFNIYTQNPMGAEQDRRLERCLGRVFSGYKIAQEMMR